MLHYKAMTATTRAEAAAAGLLRFNTGRPCRNGHTADRYTSTGNCCECLKSHSREIAAIVRAGKQPAEGGSRLFTYRLHPDDHGAALAFCQGLDLQRGRMPASSQAVAAAPPMVSATPEEVARHRERIMQDLGAAHQPQPERRQLPAEMAAALRASGLLP